MGGFEEPSRDFKKNRNLSTTGTNNGLTINLPQGIANNYNSPNSTAINSPTIQMSPVQISNPNMLQPTNNKINGSFPPPETPKASNYVKVSDEHRLVIEGVRLSMDIIESKLPNHMGYAHLILTRSLGLLNDVGNKGIKK